MWICSGDKGLLKFDGNNFISYNTSNSPMRSNLAYSIASDKFQNLWIATIVPGGQGALMKYDRFNTWSYYDTLNSGISNGNQLCVAVDTNNIVWCSNFKLSKFDGISWTVYDSTNSPLKNSSGREIYVDKNNNKWFGKDYLGLYKLQNDTTWTFYNYQNSGLGGANINKIKEDNFGNLWITMSYYGITKYDPINNLWQNWTPQNSSLISGHPWGLCIKDNVKWIGIGTGDSLTSFDNTNFTFYNRFGIVYDIMKDRLGNLWLATTEGLVEFNSTGIVVGMNFQTTIIKDFELFQNFPNPFNPTTKINYELPIINFVSLKVFDVQGKEVRTLVYEVQNSGSHSLEFNSGDLSSGIYFYKLNAGKFSETKRMLLIK